MPDATKYLRVHSEYVLVKSVGPKVTSGGDWRIFPSSSIAKLWRWRWVVSPSIVPSGNFAELIRTVTCRVLKAQANDRHTSSPLHDEFRGPHSDYVRQVALATANTIRLVGNR
ncbi:hypothetical protein TNCV_2542121 [Trichonephila clavipes]|nr:hypothetical protein TNCV_2542121 [Trichonephila clavipes]